MVKESRTLVKGMATQAKSPVPKEMVSDDSFLGVFELWWPLHGGLAEELRVIKSIARDRDTTAATMIFQFIRRAVATGDLNG